MKISLKYLLFLPFVLFFFPCFTFVLPGAKGVYIFFFIVIYILLFLLFCSNGKNLINYFIQTIKITPLKYLIFALLLTVVTTFFAAFCHYLTIANAIHSVIFQIFLFIFPILLYFLSVIDKYISYEVAIKFFILLLWLNLILGFIAYFGQYFNIDFINSIFDFFANSRTLKVETGLDIQFVANSNYTAFGMPRLDNLQEEPSYYARFLYLFFPFVYSFTNKNIDIVKNKRLNNIIYRTFIPFAWLNLIFTLSPMYLILCSIITIIYYLKDLSFLIKKHFLIILIFIVVFITCLTTIDLSDTYLSRIVNFVNDVHSISDLIMVESSLASRVVCYINTFFIFLAHPFTGIGIGNISKVIYYQYIKSPVPLTYEIIDKTKFLVKTAGTGYFNANYITQVLAESGIFVFILYVISYCKIFKFISKLHTYNAQNKESIDYYITKSLKYTFIALFIVFFYELPFMRLEIYFILVLAIAYIRKKVIEINV